MVAPRGRGAKRVVADGGEACGGQPPYPRLRLGRSVREEVGGGSGDAVAAGKAKMRRRMRRALAALSPAQRALEEELVQAAMQAAPEWQGARTVLLYRAVAPEFSIVGLTNAAWREGKRVLFPRVEGRELRLHEATSWSQLRPGAYGIPEPPVSAPAVEPAAVDLAVVPGLAWDAHGGRLGRGAGFYDRLLPQLGGPAWGVGFDAQVVERVPAAPHDARVARAWSCRLAGLL